MIVTRYKFIKIILMILFPLNQIFAQNIDFKSSNFKSDKEGFKQAIKDIKLGDEYLEKGNEAIFARTDAIDFFENALLHFLKADIFNPNNLELNLKIGNAYLYTNEKYNAFQFLQKAMDMNANEQEGSANIHFYYAIALQLEGRYGDAISQFRIFKKRQSEKRFEPFSDFYKKYIQECESAMELSDEPQKVWIDNIALNSEDDDWSPCLSADGELLIFTSNRANEHLVDDFGRYDNEIYFSTLNVFLNLTLLGDLQH